MEIYREGQIAYSAGKSCPYTDWKAGTWRKGWEATRRHYEEVIADYNKSLGINHTVWPSDKTCTLAEQVIGCFEAAECEGLSQALQETTDLRLKDLVERRLMWALYHAQEPASEPGLVTGHGGVLVWLGTHNAQEEFTSSSPEQVAKIAAKLCTFLAQKG